MSRAFALRMFPFSPRRVSNAHVRKCPEYNRIVLPNRGKDHTPGLVLAKTQGPVVSLSLSHTHTRVRARTRTHVRKSSPEVEPREGTSPFPPGDASATSHRLLLGRMASAEVPGGRPNLPF